MSILIATPCYGGEEYEDMLDEANHLAEAQMKSGDIKLEIVKVLVKLAEDKESLNNLAQLIKGKDLDTIGYNFIELVEEECYQVQKLILIKFSNQ